METAEREGMKNGVKRMKVCCVHVPTPCDECNHYTPQVCINKNKNWKNTQVREFYGAYGFRDRKSKISGSISSTAGEAPRLSL